MAYILTVYYAIYVQYTWEILVSLHLCFCKPLMLFLWDLVSLNSLDFASQISQPI